MSDLFTPMQRAQRALDVWDRYGGNATTAMIVKQANEMAESIRAALSAPAPQGIGREALATAIFDCPEIRGEFDMHTSRKIADRILALLPTEPPAQGDDAVTSLVDRLRATASIRPYYSMEDSAADTIERLEREAADMRRRLKLWEPTTMTTSVQSSVRP